MLCGVCCSFSVVGCWCLVCVVVWLLVVCVVGRLALSVCLFVGLVFVGPCSPFALRWLSVVVLLLLLFPVCSLLFVVWLVVLCWLLGGCCSFAGGWRFGGCCCFVC